MLKHDATVQIFDYFLECKICAMFQLVKNQIRGKIELLTDSRRLPLLYKIIYRHLPV